MNRCWMLGTLVFGSFIALGRNIRVTFDVMSSGVVEGILFGNSAPGDEKNRLRRILGDDSTIAYQFIYFDEDSLSKERSLYRSGDEAIIDSIGDLLTRADTILNGLAKLPPLVLSPNLNIRTAPALYQVEEAQQNITLLGLAYFLTGAEDYAEQGISLVERWFVNMQTQMTPIDLYQSEGRQYIYQLLDAIQMMHGHFEDNEFHLVQEWFRGYLKFFENAGKDQEHDGDQEKDSMYDALYYDIEDMAISHFVRDEGRIALIYKRSLERLARQVAADGSMPIMKGTSQCETNQMYTLQGWWTLARLFANAMGESLWTAEQEALCRASGYAVPYINFREPCSSEHDDQRWWPIVVDTLRHCQSHQAKRLRWRDWMTPESKEVPSSLYSMPRHYGADTGIAPFWNLGTFVKKKVEPILPQARSVAREKSGIHIPAKLLKAAEQEPDIATRVNRIKRWHQLGQKDIAERMLKKAIKDLRGTKVVWQPKDIIPQAMIDAARNDPGLDERVQRIRRWDSLGQKSIVDRMIKKTMEELKENAEDEASVEALNKQTEYARGPKGSFLRAQKGEQQNYGDPPPNVSLRSSLLKKLLKKNPSPPPPPAQATSMEIPPSLIQQSQTDPELAKRIYRIQRWKKLGQHEIVDKMIKKLLAATEDQTFR